MNRRDFIKGTAAVRNTIKALSILIFCGCCADETKIEFKIESVEISKAKEDEMPWPSDEEITGKVICATDWNQFELQTEMRTYRVQMIGIQPTNRRERKRRHVKEKLSQLLNNQTVNVKLLARDEKTLYGTVFLDGNKSSVNQHLIDLCLVGGSNPEYVVIYYEAYFY